MIRVASPLLLVATAAALLATTGCDDVSRFSTGAGQSYCGSIVLGSSFRTGLSPRVQMRLELDASAIDGPDSPGRLSTYEAATAASEERRLLTDAPLRPVPPMLHDPLSRLEFGEGRERNAIFAVSPVDPGSESLMAVVSLKSDDTVEVRLIRAGATETTDGTPEGRRPVFGVFPLTRQDGACGF
jgi:hypothetical protein